jgi:hypothetical protein
MMRCLVRMLLSLVIITASVSLVTLGNFYGVERFGDWDGGELGCAAAIAFGLGKRGIAVVLLLHLYFQELLRAFLGC